MCANDNVIWYAIGYVSASHTIHFHGNDFFWGGRWKVAKRINDGEMYTLFMKPGLEGVWQIVCHVANHLGEGMQALYQVFKEDECLLAGLEKAGISPTSM